MYTNPRTPFRFQHTCRMFKSRCLHLLLYIGLLFPLPVMARDKADVKRILQRLDSVIDHAPQYEAAKQSQIARLAAQCKAAKEPLARYRLNMQLYEEYRSYQSDSALHILEANYAIARRLQRKDMEDDCLSLMAYQSSSAGRYPDAKALLDRVDESQLKGRGRFYYYRAQTHLYTEMGYYSHLESLRDSAYHIAGRYESLLMQSLDPHSADFKEYLCRKHFNYGEMKEALRTSDEWAALVPEGSREFAMVAYYKYLIYMTMKDYDNAVYWVARSAISDITHGVMDQASLWSLADYLSGRDIDRSYKYINFSWECASKFGASVRAAQISPILSVIGSEYKDKLDGANKRLRIFLSLLSFFAVALLIMLYYVTQQRHHLTEARNDLRKRNEQLAESNGKLEESNEKLKAANGRVTTVNGQLHESNQIKEAYIGRFLTLCSEYVDRMDKSRKTVGRLVKARKYDELYEASRSTEQKEKDLEQLQEYFDSTFLNIFPTFVDDFNALLKPENRIEVPQGKLNTTLRIFALIRLGIDDSGKIAEFLHYSVNTIYNYRARTKNGCLGNRDEFEEEVKKLGKI